MTCRVHYTNPEGRRAYKDVTAERHQAEAVFLHHYPGCRVQRVETWGAPKKRTAPREDATAELPLDATPAPTVTEAERPEPSGHSLRIFETAFPGRQRPSEVDRSTSNAKWFARGKEARNNREPRDKVDGRMSPKNRAAFQAGWDEQERFVSGPTEEQVTAHNEIAKRLSEWCRQNL